METGPDCGHSGNGGPMAPGWIPLVLERDFESSTARREKTDIETSPGSHLPNDGGEPDLGSSCPLGPGIPEPSEGIQVLEISGHRIPCGHTKYRLEKVAA